MSSSFLSSPITEPFSPQIEKFITWCVNTDCDFEKAAIEAGFPAEMGKHLYKRRLIKAEVDKRMAAVKGEVVKIIAQRKVVTTDALDKNLMKVVRLTKKDITAAPALAASKVKAIELGYQRVGILIDGNFIPDAGTETNKPDEAPRIFRASEQSIITHSVTETRQVVTNRSVEAAQPPAWPKPAEPASTIDAEDDSDPWNKF